MREITDFDDRNHRIESAGAAYQKGLYHLFTLKNQETNDSYVYILRMYQCLFQLSLTELLLDFSFPFNEIHHIPAKLRQHCKDSKNPTRKELDPAALVNHSMLEKKRYAFSDDKHPLKKVSEDTLQLFRRVVDSRHNLLYRPFMLDGGFWEDCTLINLLTIAPEINEIQSVYKDFFRSLLDWHQVEYNKKEPCVSLSDIKKSGQSNSPRPRIAGYFLERLFIVYIDNLKRRPTETLLLTYARLLNPKDPEIIEKIKNYRNELLEVDQLKNIPGINLLKGWRVGEV